MASDPTVIGRKKKRAAPQPPVASKIYVFLVPEIFLNLFYHKFLLFGKIKYF